MVVVCLEAYRRWIVRDMQGGPKNGATLITIILSNLNRFTNFFTGRFPGKFVFKWITKLPPHLA